jgi:hypothetical protein
LIKALPKRHKLEDLSRQRIVDLTKFFKYDKLVVQMTGKKAQKLLELIKIELYSLEIYFIKTFGGVI